MGSLVFHVGLDPCEFTCVDATHRFKTGTDRLVRSHTIVCQYSFASDYCVEHIRIQDTVVTKHAHHAARFKYDALNVFQVGDSFAANATHDVFGSHVRFAHEVLLRLPVC